MKKKKVTKPSFKVNWATVERLLKRGCSANMAAAKIGCSFETLKKYFFKDGKNKIEKDGKIILEFSTFSEYIEYMKSKGNVDVLDTYYKLALGGDRYALEFILKNKLGWSDKKSVDNNHSGNVTMSKLTINTPPPSEDEE